MKFETQQMLAKVASHLHDDKDLYNKFNEFVKYVKRTEKVLTEGGYLQDSNGTLVKTGDFISFICPFGPKAEQVAYAKLEYWAGRFHVKSENRVSDSYIWDTQDLIEQKIKFFKVEEDLDEEPVWATVKGERRLLKPVVMKKDDGETYLEMNDDESNFYKMDEVDWVGSSFS